MQKLVNQVINWGNEKGICFPENLEKQALKSQEELGELAKAILQKDLPQVEDAIGDSMVTIILHSSIVGYNMKHVLKQVEKREYRDYECIAMCHTYLNYPNEYNLVDAISCLDTLAGKYGFTLQQCLQTAYDVISKRTGKTVDGVFVKSA